MEPSVLHSQIPAFEEQDNCLFFILGLARTTVHLRQFAERQAASEPRFAASQPLATPVTAGEGEAPLFFILGLLSFANRYHKILNFYQVGYLESTPAGPPSNGHQTPRLAIRDFLR